MIFRPGFRLTPGNLGLEWTKEELGAEVEMASASLEFVRRRGGPITNRILDEIPGEYFEHMGSRFPAINVVVSHLEEGEYPTYPHWHYDAGTPKSQDELDWASGVPQYIMFMISTRPCGLSNTRLLDQEVEGEGSPFPELWARCDLHTRYVPDNVFAVMHPWSIHAAQPARARGTRLFFRITTFGQPCHGIVAPTKKVIVPGGDLSKAFFKENTWF